MSQKAKMRDAIFSVEHTDIYIKQAFTGKYGKTLPITCFTSSLKLKFPYFRYFDFIFHEGFIQE